MSETVVPDVVIVSSTTALLPVSLPVLNLPSALQFEN